MKMKKKMIFQLWGQFFPDHFFPDVSSPTHFFPDQFLSRPIYFPVGEKMSEEEMSVEEMARKELTIHRFFKVI
jgi:hypothetical protein